MCMTSDAGDVERFDVSFDFECVFLSYASLTAFSSLILIQCLDSAALSIYPNPETLPEQCAHAIIPMLSQHLIAFTKYPGTGAS